MTFTPIKPALDTLNGASEIHYERRWVALLTVPNQEQKSATWLRRIAWRSPTEVYWPKKFVQAASKVQQNGRQGRAPQVRPIIYGMIFAHIVNEMIEGYHPFEDFNATPGIRGWLRNEQRAPRYISIPEMHMVMNMEATENELVAPAPERELKVGDNVRVTSETLQCPLPGVITRLNGDGSVCVDVRLFGGAFKLVLERHHVELEERFDSSPESL